VLNILSLSSSGIFHGWQNSVPDATVRVWQRWGNPGNENRGKSRSSKKELHNKKGDEITCC
jgi:hypothetical protein